MFRWGNLSDKYVTVEILEVDKKEAKIKCFCGKPLTKILSVLVSYPIIRGDFCDDLTEYGLNFVKNLDHLPAISRVRLDRQEVCVEFVKNNKDYIDFSEFVERAVLYLLMDESIQFLS